MDEPKSVVELVLCLVAIAAGLVAIIAPTTLVVWLILTPIDRAAKFRSAPPRFSVGDFLCLFLAIQIPLSAISRSVGPHEQHVFWLFTMATWIIGPLMWITCARTLSKAGIVTSTHRLLFMGFVMPAVYYGLFPFTCLSVSMVVIAFDGPDPRTPTRVIYLSWGLLALLLLLSWYFTKYILRQSGPTEMEVEPQALKEPYLRSREKVVSVINR